MSEVEGCGMGENSAAYKKICVVSCWEENIFSKKQQKAEVWEQQLAD